MQLQTNQAINFKATRILNAEKTITKGRKELVEVFKLDANTDTEFIKKCHDILSANKNRKLTAFQKRLKSILKGFLDKTTSFSEDYYIAIKNNEEIIGCMNSIPFIKDVIPLNIFTSQNKEQNNNTLFYALLKDSQKNYKGFNINLKEVGKKLSILDPKIKFEQIDNYKKNIENSFNKIKFKSENTKNINFDSILGIENFETETL